jgi:hypothetical protein
MKRSAIVIIMAISDTGTFKRARGDNRLSIPPAKAIGLVVIISMEANITRKYSLSPMDIASVTPSSVILRGPRRKSSRPGVQKIFSAAVKITRNRIGRPERSTVPSFMAENLVMAARQTAIGTKPDGVRAIKGEAISMKIQSNLHLGSSE